MTEARPGDSLRAAIKCANTPEVYISSDVCLRLVLGETVTIQYGDKASSLYKAPAGRKWDYMIGILVKRRKIAKNRTKFPIVVNLEKKKKEI